MDFIPEQSKNSVDVPYFEDVTGEVGWQGQSTTKSIETFKTCCPQGKVILWRVRFGRYDNGYQTDKRMVMDKWMVMLVLALAMAGCGQRGAPLERKVYMPVITRLDNDLRGVEVWPGSHHLEDLQELHPALVRAPLLWLEGEPVRGDYRTDIDVIRIIKLAHLAGAKSLLTIKAAPDWAGGCAGIRPNRVEDFVNFWGWAVKRYEAEAFEFWNEPDAGLGQCPYYGMWSGGGAYYGQVAVRLSSVTHQAGKLFVFGAIADPQGSFLGEALSEIQPGAVDLVSYHYYSGYGSMIALDEVLAGIRKVWKGGVILGETSLMWEESWGGRTEEQHRVMQARYYQVLYMWSRVNQAPFVWYGLDDPGWRWAGLYDTQDRRTPAWWEFRGK